MRVRIYQQAVRLQLHVHSRGALQDGSGAEAPSNASVFLYTVPQSHARDMWCMCRATQEITRELKAIRDVEQTGEFSYFPTRIKNMEEHSQLKNTQIIVSTKECYTLNLETQCYTMTVKLQGNISSWFLNLADLYIGVATWFRRQRTWNPHAMAAIVLHPFVICRRTKCAIEPWKKIKLWMDHPVGWRPSKQYVTSGWWPVTADRTKAYMPAWQYQQVMRPGSSCHFYTTTLCIIIGTPDLSFVFKILILWDYKAWHNLKCTKAVNITYTINVYFQWVRIRGICNITWRPFSFYHYIIKYKQSM